MSAQATVSIRLKNARKVFVLSTIPTSPPSRCFDGAVLLLVGKQGVTIGDGGVEKHLLRIRVLTSPSFSAILAEYWATLRQMLLLLLPTAC